MPLSWIIYGIFGAVAASAVMCFVDRRVKERSWKRGRSLCDHCGKALAWWKLIPIIGYAIQLGKASCCRKRLSGWLIVSEITGALMGVVAARAALDGLLAGALMILVSLWVLYTLSEDALAQQVDIRLASGAVVLGLALNWPVSGWWAAAVVAGAGFFGVQYVATRGRGIGSGDLWIGAAMGAILGWPMVGVGVLMGYVVGGSHAAWLLLLKRAQKQTRLPLGAYLCVGLALTLAFQRVLRRLLFGV